MIDLSTDLLQSILEDASDLVAAIGPDFRLLACNQAYRAASQSILGASVEVGSNLLEGLAHAPLHQERARALWERALKGERFTVLLDMEAAEETRHYEVSFYPLRNNSTGAILGAAHVVRDLTAHVRETAARQVAEASLAASERRSLLAQQAARIGVWECDSATGQAHWSDVQFALHGFPRAAGTPAHADWLGLLHPEDRERVEAALVRAHQGDVYEEQFRVILPDGSHRWLLGRGERFDLADGRGPRLLGINIDITAQKEIAAALSVSEERLRLAQAAAHVGIWDWRVDEDRCNWGDETASLLGLARGTSAGSLARLIEVIEPEDRAHVQESVKKALAGNDAYQVEFRVTHPDGSQHWIAAQGEVLRDDSGHPARMLGVAVDVTQRKQAETERERLTAALRRSNEELERFAYVASHDLQEPLRGIAAYSQLLAERKSSLLDQESLEYLGYVREGAARMRRLIVDLLSYAKLGDPGHLEPVNMQLLLDWTRVQMEYVIRDAGATILSGPLPVVLGQERQLLQLWQNLLSNALKYRHPDRLCHIHISAAREGAFWRFTIEDNGIGFDPMQTERIFTPFRRLHGNEVPGTGMGLAISKRIVEVHGGQIGAEGRPDEGATFWFTLPATHA